MQLKWSIAFGQSSTSALRQTSLLHSLGHVLLNICFYALVATKPYRIPSAGENVFEAGLGEATRLPMCNALKTLALAILRNASIYVQRLIRWSFVMRDIFSSVWIALLPYLTVVRSLCKELTLGRIIALFWSRNSNAVVFFLLF